MFNIKESEYFKRPYYAKTTSICPDCEKIIPAEIVEKENKIIIQKVCPDCGKFEDIVSGDAGYYKWTHYGNEHWSFEKDGEANTPDITECKAGCPYSCGLCSEHKSTCSLALIDITNRCNFTCNFCYANVNSSGKLVEFSLSEIERTMDHFRNKEIPAIAVMFAGGEPTTHPDFVEVCRMAKNKGFSEIIVATNGYGFQKPKTGLEFTKQCKEAGLDCLYLQFDGVNDSTYLKTRGVKLKAYKQRVIDHCREAGLDSIVLVVTVVKGITDKEIGNILQYAIDNSDVVSGVIFQPVSLCGRISGEEVRKYRINNSDVLMEIERQTNGTLKLDLDWYPLTTVVEFGRLLSWLNNAPPVEFTCHPDCGFATYMVLNPETNQMESIFEYVDVFNALTFANSFWNKYKPRSKGIKVIQKLFNNESDITKTIDKSLSLLDQQQLKLRFVAGMLPYIKKSGKFMEIFARLLVNPKWDTISSFTYGSLLIGSMHFQDAYNFNIERVKRCIVHYGIPMPDGTVREIPFCAHNNFHREKIEAELAKPYNGMKVEDWSKHVEGKEIEEIQKAKQEKKENNEEKEVFIESTNLNIGLASQKQQKMLDRIKYFEKKRSPFESFIETMASKMVATTLSVKKTIEQKTPAEKMGNFWNTWTSIMLGF